mmetsp:Transcript_10192/g.18452  ORF Transcript_10192/g.18452 Transcript_10192/m.18452 type:complete len:81 (+) Transcript_10192:179-421(+)
MSLPTQTTHLYRHFLRLASTFPDYNVRSYALRSVQTRFRERAANPDVEAVKMEESRLRRMISVSGNYVPEEKNVMQNLSK